MYFNSVKPNILVRVILCVIALASVTCIATPAYAQSDSDTLMTVTEPDTVRMAVDPTAVAMDTLVAASDTPAVATDSLANDTVRHAIAALKNNLLYDAIATMNLHAEFRLDEHWTLEAGVGFNPFPIDDTKFPKWRHIYVDIAPRYWFCQAFTRDFVSVNLGYSHYNVAGGVYPIGWMYKDVQTNRFQGDALLFGASYGWVFPITKHFSIELEGGVDGGITWYDQFTCKHCGKQLAEKQKKWFALPRVGVNLVVLLDDSNDDFEDRCDCGKLHPNEEAADTTVIMDSTIVATVDTVTADTIATVPLDTIAPVDTIAAVVPEDTVVAVAPVDTIVPVIPVDTVVAIAPVDTVVPVAPADTVAPVDTIIPVIPVVQPVLPIVPIVPDIPSADSLRQRKYEIEEELRLHPSDSLRRVLEKIITMQTRQAYRQQISRVHSNLLRPLAEFEPYDPHEKITKEPNSIYLHFDVDKTIVDRSFIHNDELMDSIVSVIAEALQDTTIEIKLIKLVGMASFDGSLKGNICLAGSRGDALREFLQERFGFTNEMFRVYNGGESWAELRWFLDKEEFDGKDYVMKVMDEVEDYDQRERLIKQHNNGATYKYMQKHFQRYLRNLGTITVYYIEK